MHDLDEGIGWLESLSVRFRPKSSDTYDKAFELAQMFEHSPPPDRATLVAKVSDQAAKKLLSLSAFLAERAMDTGDAKWLKAAVLLHVMEDFRKDYRENIRYLVLVDYAAKSINAQLESLIDGAIPLASDRTKRCLTDFKGRAAELNELDKFGVKVALQGGERRFVQV